MPILHVSIAAGRSDEMVENFIREVIKTTSATLNAPESAVTVIVNQIPHTHLAVAGKLKSES
ncbi:tautomerase family protein [Corynebacterium caspium]|uniref:tautomerase family protein n=1 Tax=Corynebacterium caspium TaxID=234828 RepID=UPI000369956E|nr:tautomerase family protein [Corynebacterium caspium]WKD58834.1 2-hydroxymuconate tautomerase [Corynebacterium caspium DSM 44850]